MPLAAALGGGMRIYFEGEVEGQPANSMHSVDSVDGWVGRDFHPGGETVCSWEDLEPGGECEATPILTPEDAGVDDLLAIRQGKLAYPPWTTGAGTAPPGPRCW